MRYALTRWWMHRKLWRGRCPQCAATLPDSAPVGSLCGDPVCSERDWQAWT